MKKFIWGTILILASALACAATNVTVSSVTLSNQQWANGATTVKLRIYSNKMFIASDGTLLMPGANFYQELTASVSGTDITVPSFSIDPTTDSSIPTATYSAVFFDTTGRQRDTYLNNFRVPHDLGSNITWAQIITFTLSAPNPPPPGYYTNAQVNTLIASAVSNLNLELDISAYSNSLATAVSSIGSTETTLKIASAVTVPASVTVPKNIKLHIIDDGLITVAASQTLTIGALVDPGNRKVFTSSASGAKVLFSKAAVKEINLAWWVGNTSGADITDAFGEALESASANQGAIYIPAGEWLTSGGHQITGNGVTVRGNGNTPFAAESTSVKLSSPTANYVLKIGELIYSTRLENIMFDGTGTTNRDGLLLEGTAPNTSADLEINKVTFANFRHGLNYNSLGGSWQFAQVKITQSIFQANTTAGFRCSSVNSAFTFIDTNLQLAANSVGFKMDACGVVNIINSEIAGAGAGNNSKGMTISASHAHFNFVGGQIENAEIFIENNASDIESIVNLYGVNVQGVIQFNQSGTLNSFGSTFMSYAFQDDVGVVANVTSHGDRVREVSANDGVTVVSPAVLTSWTGGSNVIFEENSYTGAITSRLPTRSFSPPALDGNASTPQYGIGHYTAGSESKILLRLGRLDASEAFDFYYDILRQNSGDAAGRLKFSGNQTGFVGYDFEDGDLWVEGAVRGQAVGYSSAATITIDPRSGNHQYVTLNQATTIEMVALSSFDQTRSDGQRLTLELIQDGVGSRTCALTTGANDQFAFGTDITSITCTTTATKRDILEVVYSARARRWMVIGFTKGFE